MNYILFLENTYTSVYEENADVVNQDCLKSSNDKGFDVVFVTKHSGDHIGNVAPYLSEKIKAD